MGRTLVKRDINGSDYILNINFVKGRVGGLMFWMAGKAKETFN